MDVRRGDKGNTHRYGFVSGVEAWKFICQRVGGSLIFSRSEGWWGKERVWVRKGRELGRRG